MSVDEVTEELSVMSLSRHVFDYKQRIETFPNFNSQVSTLDMNDLLGEWASINRPLWKKARAFASVVAIIDDQSCLKCIESIKEQVSRSATGSVCKLPPSSAAFYLLSLDSLLGRLSTTGMSISACLVSLVSVLDFDLASKLQLPNLASCFGEIVSAQKIDERIIQCSFFAPGSAFTSDFLASLGKYLSELKGWPDQFILVSKFLKTVFVSCHTERNFVDILDRLSKRNSSLCAFILNDMVSFVALPQESAKLYDSIVETLCQVDNEAVIACMLKIAAKIPVSHSLLSKIQPAFKGFNPRVKEIVSKFIASLVQGKDASGLPDFGEYLQKELNAESTLASLTQYCTSTSSTHLSAFLTAYLKSSQRLVTRSAIMLGLLRADFKSWNDDLLLELFSSAFVKDANQPCTTASLSFYICAFATLVQNPQFQLDSKLFSDALSALSKPGGVALGCEKGWAQMDDSLSAIWIEKVIAPVVFGSLCPGLVDICCSSMAWIIVSGSQRTFKLLIRNCKALSLETTEAVSLLLQKSITVNQIDDSAIHRIWKFLKCITCHANLKSTALAVLCHQEKLLGNGDASWPELVRKQITNVDEFCLNFLKENDAKLFVNLPFLSISVISLSPQVITENFELPGQLFKDIEALKSVSDADLSIFFAKPVTSKTPASKPTKPQTPTVDNSALKEAIGKLIDNLKASLSLTCSAAIALPFHPSFTVMRPEIICKLLDLLLAAPKLAQTLPLIHSIYTIAAESFDGQGPLLISLCLRCCGLTELSDLVDSSWNIESDSLLFSSSVEIAKKMESDELFIACETFAGALLKMAKEQDSLKSFITILSSAISNVAGAKVPSSCAKMVSALFELVLQSPTLAPFITSCLIEFGELEGLVMSNGQFERMNCLLRASSASVRLVILKFLVAFVASRQSTCTLSTSLLNTIWLLHFEPLNHQHGSNEDEGEEVESDLGTTFAAKEVSIVATELFEMLQQVFEPASEDSILADLLLLENEKGVERNVSNMIDSYVGALIWRISASKNVSPLFNEFVRLLQARSTPNGIVRLTKNVDRSKLDFTKQTRRALIQVLAGVCKHSSDPELLSGIVSFAFKSGFADTDELNCQLLFDGLLAAVSNFSEALYSQLQAELNATALNDRAQVYAVIAVGRAASSMSLDSDRIWSLIARIQETLKVPSESVQLAVADTLVPLLRTQVGDKRVSEMFSTLAQRLRESKEEYGALRGVATGMAAVLQACGTGLIRELDIFSLWTESLSRLGQKNSEPFICSSLASIEMASARCGIAFEPYIPPLVPGVLEALGDNRSRVRQDAESCADAMMSALSPLSVSSILPPLLEMAGADGSDPRYSWRAKLGAVTWLGSMAKLAPKILTPALPRIIPALIVALTDAHEKVHLAAHHALAVKYASIIRSPEIKAALPAVLRALSDPPKYASSCLGDIIGTSFCHAVDGPSLALLEPLLTRALRERGTGAMTEAKRRAILIIANLGSLMDPQELKPYLNNLVPSLRGVLGDAVPQVRAGASRALGIMTRLMHSNGIKSEVLDQIVPECLETIFSNLPSVSAIDRAGAALAVSQVASSWGLDALIKLVDEKVVPCLFGEEARNVSSASREALLHLLAALPEASPKTCVLELYRRVFGPERLLAIFEGTADEDEGVREVSSKTCRSLVLRQALLVDLESSMDILLRAAGDGRWRVRLTAFTILTDLLPALVMGEDSSRCDTKTRTLSLEMCSRVLSRLYFGRFDGNSHIRNSAFSLWKSIVTHPPRVIMEILPVLVDDCVASLCIEDEDEEDEDEFEDEEAEFSSEDEELNASKSSAASKSLPSSQKSSQTPISFKLDKYEMATAALRDILMKLADRVLLPFTRRLAHLFLEQPKARPGILAAAGILAQTAIVPCLIPPHLRTDSSAVLSVQVPRTQLDEALNLILQMMQQGLTSEDTTGTVISTSVRLLDRLEKGLIGCPALLEKIVNDLLSAGSEAVVAILCRRPQILLAALTLRFKKLSASDDVDWNWWAEVFTASGPYLASQAAGLLAHLLKLRQDVIDEEVEELFDALLASMSTYDPEVLYGDPDLQGDDDEDLDDLVDTGLFSFGQLLETLWSARNLRQLSAQIVYRFASQGKFGCERFYDIWLDRLLLGAIEEASAEDCGESLNALITAAVENGDACAVIENCLSAFENRSALGKNLGKLPLALVSNSVKVLLLPVLADTDTFSTSERFSAAQFLKLLIVSESGEPCRLPASAITSLLGALIRTLSDRASCTERIRAALLAIPVHLLVEASTALACKPFHPQLARLTVNVLKDIIAATDASDISFDSSHARGEALLLATKLAAQLMSTMTRIDAFLEELGKFAFLESEAEEEEQIYDEMSIKNARLVLLRIFNSISVTPVPAASKFIDNVLRGLILLPGSQNDLVEAAGACGRDLVRRQFVEESLAAFINQYI